MEFLEQKKTVSEDGLIEIKDEVIVDSFRLSDLEKQIELIDGQIAKIKSVRDEEIAKLEAEKLVYRDKIQDNAYEGYLMPDFKFVFVEEVKPIEEPVETEEVIEEPINIVE